MTRKKYNKHKISDQGKQTARELIKNLSGKVAVYIDVANLEKPV